METERLSIVFDDPLLAQDEIEIDFGLVEESRLQTAVDVWRARMAVLGIEFLYVKREGRRVRDGEM